MICNLFRLSILDQVVSTINQVSPMFNLGTIDLRKLYWVYLIPRPLICGALVAF